MQKRTIFVLIEYSHNGCHEFYGYSQGSGKVTSYKEGKGLVQEKCKDCYGTGHKRRPISQMPKGTVPNEKID